MFLHISCALLACGSPQDSRTPPEGGARVLSEAHGFRLSGGPVRALAVSGDGRLLASGGSLGDVQVFDVAARERVCAFDASTGEIRQLAFDRHARRLGVLAADLTTWTIPAGTKMRRLQTGKDGDVELAIGWRAEGATLVAPPPPDDWRVFANRAERGGAVFEHPGARTICIAVDAHGDLVATGGDDGRILIWQDGEVAAVFAGHVASARSVALTADGRTAVASDGCRARLVNLDPNAPEPVTRELEQALVVARGRDGGLLVLTDAWLRWLDARGQERTRVPLPRWPEQPVVPRCRLVTDPSGAHVLATVEAQTYLVHQSGEGVEVVTRELGTGAAAWWPDGRRCAIARAGSGFMLSCGIGKPDPVAALPLQVLSAAGAELATIEGLGGAVALDVSPDGTSLVGADALEISRWSVGEARVARSVPATMVWIRWLDRERLVAHDGGRVAIYAAGTLERLALLDPWRNDEACRGEILCADLAGRRLILGTTRDVRIYDLR